MSHLNWQHSSYKPCTPTVVRHYQLIIPQHSTQQKQHVDRPALSVWLLNDTINRPSGLKMNFSLKGGSHIELQTSFLWLCPSETSLWWQYRDVKGSCSVQISLFSCSSIFGPVPALYFWMCAAALFSFPQTFRPETLTSRGLFWWSVASHEPGKSNFWVKIECAVSMDISYESLNTLVDINQHPFFLS